jgi:hypothetical protein
LFDEEELEDTKMVIRIRKSKKETTQGQKKDKRTNNDLQSKTHKTKDRATRTHQHIAMRSVVANINVQ